MTILVACISKSSLDYENTLSTLIYCQKATNITKVQKPNVKISLFPKETKKSTNSEVRKWDSRNGSPVQTGYFHVASNSGEA